MPIYTFKCKNCGKVTEKFKSMNSNGSEICDYCSSEAIRIFTPAGIIFKGSGFYTTDYKSDGNKAGAKNIPKKTDEKEMKKPESKNGSPSEQKTGPGEKSSVPVANAEK